MDAVRLIHWKEEEARERVQVLRAGGFEVKYTLPGGPKFLQELEAEKPRAVVIDLSRLPSQGRDFAVLIRKRKGTRHIPLVFVSDEPEKFEPIKKLLPDASFCSWAEITRTLNQLSEAPPDEVVVPDSAFAAYAGRPLVDKLGVKTGSWLALVNPPDDFPAVLGELPDGAELIFKPDRRAQLALWFVRSIAELESEIAAITAFSRTAPVWIAWPKKGAAQVSDLSQQAVREAGMSAGMVDYKICSVDRNWSALLFTWRGLP